jgi:hypothetical protein
MIQFLQEYQKKHPNEPPHQLPYLGVAGGPKTNRNRRSAVSAEPLMRVSTRDKPPVVVPKSDAEKQRIREAVKGNFLFESLEPSQLSACLDAMQLREYKAGDTIITQGEEGEHFFVVDSGECECWVVSQDKPKPRRVRKYAAGGTFGELVLAPLCPLAPLPLAPAPCPLPLASCNALWLIVLCCPVLCSALLCCAVLRCVVWLHVPVCRR